MELQNLLENASSRLQDSGITHVTPFQAVGTTWLMLHTASGGRAASVEMVADWLNSNHWTLKDYTVAERERALAQPNH